MQCVEEHKTPSVLGPSVMTEKEKGGPLPSLVAKYGHKYGHKSQKFCGLLKGFSNAVY